MTQQVKRRARKRRGKIKISSSARLVEKNDKTRVARKQTFPRMQAQMPRTTGVVFRVKVKKR